MVPVTMAFLKFFNYTKYMVTGLTRHNLISFCSLLILIFFHFLSHFSHAELLLVSQVLLLGSRISSLFLLLPNIT